MAFRHLPMRGMALIALVLLLLTTALYATRAKAQTEPDNTYAAVDRFVEDEMDGSRIPGIAIAIIEDGQIAHARGFGDDGDGNAISPQTPFPIGSLTKSVTALAVMQLVEAGAIDLDAPVQQYLPTFRSADPNASAQITVHHLLNHTSGFSRADGAQLVLDESQASMEEIVTGLQDVKLNRPVGATYEYSNINFVVLGLLVQTASGQSWAEYVQQHILDPIGMSNTYTTFAEAEAHGLTSVHQYWFGIPRERDLTYLPGLAPTGYLASTAEDMARYLAMYLAGGVVGDERLLSEAGIAAMLSGETNESSRQLLSQEFAFRYGRGWFVGPFGAADDARWHLGELPTFNAWMVLLPESNQAAVVLINAGSQMEIAGANSVLSRIPQGVVTIMRGEEPPSGTSITTFYTFFNIAVVVVLAVQVWSLYRVARRRTVLPLPPHGARRAASLACSVGPLVWELVLGAGLLLGYPALTGMSWGANLHSLPDLTLVVLAVAALWLTTGVVRTARLAVALRQPGARASAHAASGRGVLPPDGLPRTR